MYDVRYVTRSRQIYLPHELKKFVLGINKYAVFLRRGGCGSNLFFIGEKQFFNIEYRLTNVKCRSGARRHTLLHFTFVNRYSILKSVGLFS
jgi:hypothetical protein